MTWPNFKVGLERIHQPLLELQAAIAPVILSADVVRSNTTMTALADLSREVESGKKYAFSITFRVTDSAMEGIKVDLNGGTATVSSIWVTYEFKDLGFATLKHAAALNTVASVEGLAGGDGLVQIIGSFTASADGTFVPRVAQNSHSSGSLTILEGSWISLQEIP